MEKKIINCYQGDKIVDMSFVLNKKYLKENLLFVTWDYEKNRFVMLDSHKDKREQNE